jgi:hypothetical protein
MAFLLVAARTEDETLSLRKADSFPQQMTKARLQDTDTYLQVTMVILGSISTFCWVNVKRCICCKKKKSADTNATQTVSNFKNPKKEKQNSDLIKILTLTP